MSVTRFAVFLLAGVAFAQNNAALPTVFVAGDSTANNTNHQGWGDPFADYFDPTKCSVQNRARAGRSARTFLGEGLWDKVVADVKPGDYVLIQFGHNDGGPPGEKPFRGDLPGIGEESQEFTMPGDRTELVHTFGWYIRKFVNDTKAKGAYPIVMSLTVRNIWKDGRVERGSGEFGKWSKAVADAEKVPFVDVTDIIADVYEKMGEDKVKPLFPVDHTHTSPEGADLNASLIVAGLRGIHAPLTQWLSAKGLALSPVASPLALHLPVPANPALPTLFLIGDSTVRNGYADGAGGQWGWGEPIVDLFDTAKINVVNRAVGGLSSRNFYTGVYWSEVLAMIKPGDFVVMQFGHNDEGALDGPTGYRASLPGTGDETRMAGGEAVRTFGWYLRRYVEEARAKGATAIVCSLVPRKIWKDGRIARSGDYAKWAAEVAQAEKASFVDLNEIIAGKYDRLWMEKVEGLFADPHTHTSRAGAELNAAAVVEGLRGLRPDPLGGYLRE